MNKSALVILVLCSFQLSAFVPLTLKVQRKAVVIKWADSQKISVCIVVFSEEQDDIIPEAIALDY